MFIMLAVECSIARLSFAESVLYAVLFIYKSTMSFKKRGVELFAIT